jgi:hypothetical protein
MKIAPNSVGADSGTYDILKTGIAVMNSDEILKGMTLYNKNNPNGNQ